MAQYLGLGAFTMQRAQVQSLVRELRSHKPHDMAKKKKKDKAKALYGILPGVLEMPVIGDNLQ